MAKSQSINKTVLSLLIGCLLTHSASAVEFEIADDILIELEGKLHYDVASIDDGMEKKQDSQIRRARVSATAKFGKDVRATLEYDVKNRSLKVEDAYLEYRGFDKTSIKAGQVGHAVGLEGSSSSSQLPFMERSLMNDFLPDNGVGVQISTYNDHWTVSGSVTGDEMDSLNELKDKLSAKEVVSLRATAVLAKDDDSLLHLGATLSRTDPKGKKVRFRANAGSKLSKTVISTGKQDGIDSYVTEGLEVAWSKGALLLQGEYMRTQLHNNQKTQDNLEGWYVSAAYTLSGTSHKYNKKKGVFRAPKLKKGKKNIELVARIGELNLNTSSISGGVAKNKTMGANYYVDDKTRLMLDYGWTDIESGKNTHVKTNKTLQARWQRSFY